MTTAAARTLSAVLLALTVVGCATVDDAPDPVRAPDAEAARVLQDIIEIAERIHAETGQYPEAADEYVAAGLDKPDDAVIATRRSTGDDGTEDGPICVEVTIGDDTAAWQPADGLGVTDGDCNSR